MRLSMMIILALFSGFSFSVFADNPLTSDIATSSNTTDLSTQVSTSTTPATSPAAISPSQQSTPNTSAPLLFNDTDRLSYSLGVDIGRNFKNQNITLNPAAITQGLKDGLSGSKPLMTSKDMQTTLINLQ